MARARTSNGRFTSRRKSYMGPVGMTLAATAALGAIGGLIWNMTRPRTAHAPTNLEYIPDNPAHDRFGNTGENNLVEPLTLREDEDNMRDRMNTHPGLI